MSLPTRLTLAAISLEHGDCTYDCDYYGDELPFWQTVEGKPHLIIPLTKA